MKGDIKQCAKFVGSKFSYKSDKRFIFDQWFVMKDKDGKFYGDCDDFTITVLWYYYGCSLLSFIWNVFIKHDCKIIRVKSPNGEWHIIGSVDGLYFDNWTREAVPKDEFFARTRHTPKMRYFGPFMILMFLTGLLFR